MCITTVILLMFDYIIHILRHVYRLLGLFIHHEAHINYHALDYTRVQNTNVNIVLLLGKLIRHVLCAVMTSC